MPTFEKMADPAFLKREFEEIDFSFFHTRPNSEMSCFVATIEHEGMLNEYWLRIASVIAAEYQSKLETLEVWNIYLVFLVKQGEVSKRLKYKIENDKFSMRKLLAPCITTEDEIVRYLNNEILGADLPEKANIDKEFPLEEEVGNHLRDAIIRMVSQKKSNGDDFTPHDLMTLAGQVNK